MNDTFLESELFWCHMISRSHQWMVPAAEHHVWNHIIIALGVGACTRLLNTYAWLHALWSPRQYIKSIINIWTNLSTSPLHNYWRLQSRLLTYQSWTYTDSWIMTHIITVRLRGMNHSLAHWDKIYTCATGQSLLLLFLQTTPPPQKKERKITKKISSIEVEKAKELKGNKHIPPKSQRWKNVFLVCLCLMHL